MSLRLAAEVGKFLGELFSSSPKRGGGRKPCARCRATAAATIIARLMILVRDLAGPAIGGLRRCRGGRGGARVRGGRSRTGWGAGGGGAGGGRNTHEIEREHGGTEQEPCRRRHKRDEQESHRPVKQPCSLGCGAGLARDAVGSR
jgi:hypothetical protein